MEYVLFFFTMLYTLLPAVVANMAPGVANRYKLPFGTPVYEPLFGAHKTWRGFYSSVIAGFIIGGIQTYVHKLGYLHDVASIDYGAYGVLSGTLIAAGAKLGDTMKSMIKRLANHKPSAPWFPWDQIDYVLGATLPVWWFAGPDGLLYCATFLLFPLVLGRCASRIAYMIGHKKVPW